MASSSQQTRCFLLTTSFAIFLMMLGALYYTIDEFAGTELYQEVWLFISISLILVILLGLVLFGKVDRVRINWVDVSVFSFFTYSLINCYYKISYWPTLCHTSILIVSLMLTYLAIRVLADNDFIKPSYFISCLVGITFLCFIVAFLQFIDALPSRYPAFRITGGYFNPAPFAIHLTSLCAFLVPGIYYMKNRKCNHLSSALFYILLTSSIIVIALCGSRAALIGFSFSVCTVLLLMEKTRVLSYWNKLHYKAIWLFLATGLLSFLGALLFNLKRDSALGRLLTWKVSLNLAEDSGLTGVGSSQFQVKYAEYQYKLFSNAVLEVKKFENIAGDVRFAFNDFLQLLCEEGIAGLLLFVIILWVIASSIKKGMDRKKSDGHKIILASCLACIGTLLVSGLFSYPLNTLSIKVFFWLIIAVISSVSRSKSVSISLKRTPVLKVFVVSSLAFISMALCSYGLKRLNAYEQLIEGSNLNSKELLKIHPVLADHSYFLLHLGRSFIYENSFTKALSVLEDARKTSQDKEIYYELGGVCVVLRRYTDAEKYFKFIYVSQPALITPKYLLAKLYYKNGEKIKWKRMAKEIIDSKPKVESFNTLYMQQEIRALLAKETRKKTMGIGDE